MSRQGVTLMCYWNGTTTSGPHGISYEGAAPKPIRVSYGITHNELVDKIYGVTGFDKKSFKLKIICRYPACREYIPVPIDDDESIDIMFDVARQPGTNCLELYVEREQVYNQDPINVVEPTMVDNQTIDELPTHDAQVESFLDPGPVDNSVLVLQNQHRSEAIWAGEVSNVLTCRQRLAALMKDWKLDHRVRQLIIKAGFYGVYRVGILQIDWPLITALVERWRQETHTFHFTVGESTVTLQDVALLLGVPINGWVVTGNTDLSWEDLCEELLGLRPDSSVLRGSALKISWLRTHFGEPPPNADDVTLRRHARAYILGLMGGVLFTDKSGSDVQLIFLPFLRDLESVEKFSWGSAVLAHLYRELCRSSKKGANEISGPLIMLQIWAWERLDVCRPERLCSKGRKAIILDKKAEEENRTSIVGDVFLDDEQLPADPLGCRWKAAVIRRDNPHRALIFYRDQLDQQTDDQMIWQPYTSERLASLPDSFLKDQHLWRTIAPLISFDIVEWHRPDRVLRQFGLRQEIPVHCDTEIKLHTIDRRGKHHYDWNAHHGHYIKLWEDREKNVAMGEPENQPMHYHDPYMVWYRSITRRLITPLTQRSHMRFQPSSGTSHLLVQSLTTIFNQCACTLDSFTSDEAMKSLECIQTTCAQVLQMIGETRHLKRKQSVISVKPVTTLSSANDANNGENQQHKECASPPVHMETVQTKTPSVKGQGRRRGGGKGGIKFQGGDHCTFQSVVLETSPQSSLSTYSTQTILHFDNGRDRQLHLKDAEVGTMVEPEDLLTTVTSLEGGKETRVREQSPVESFLMYKESTRDVLEPRPSRSMCLSKGNKMAESASAVELEQETMHLFGKEGLERTVDLPRVGSKSGTSSLSHEHSDHPIFPKKKLKHI